MGLQQYSETNLSNSISLYLAAQLLGANYLVYWAAADAVQTPDGWYLEYSTQAATHLANAPFKARLDAATGLLTLASKVAANPQYPVRPKNDGTVPGSAELGIPELVVEVGPWVNGSPVGLGDRTRTRYRWLAIYGYARDASEQSLLRDRLAEWFDEDTVLDIADHDSGTRDLLGSARATMVTADSAIVGLAPEALVYEVILNARLEYEA